MIHPHSMSRRLVLVAVLLAAPLTACRHGESDPVGPGGVATEPTGSLVLFSLADPANPTLIARYSTPDLVNGVHTAQISRVNGKLYAFCSIDPRGTAKARLTIVDLSDPAAPRQVFTRVMG